MAEKPKPPKLSLFQNIAASAVAACTAEAVSLPLDTAKVRLQLQARGLTAPKYRGILGTLGTVAKDEGATALWKGLGPGLQRQVLYGGLRIGLFDFVKARVPTKKGSKGETSFLTKVGVGLTTSSLAIAVASPTDLVKVRMQVESKLPPGVPKRYPSTTAAYLIIVRQEGLSALWTGLGPNVARNAAVSTSALASYDQIKEGLLKTGLFHDNVYCHLASSLCAGFLSTVCGSPFDVVKSRMMGASPGTYSGVADAFAKTLRREGVLAFYNGFSTNYARLGSWNVVMFLCLEQVKALFAASQAKK